MMPLAELSSEEQKQAKSQDIVTTEGFVPLPIAFVSKGFSDAATRWTTTEQELFAIIYTLKKLEAMLTIRPQQAASYWTA